MHIGLFMECDYRQGTTQEEAFDEAFDLIDLCETTGIDAIWLAERHFAPKLRPDGVGGVPSIASAPLVLGAAAAGRTKNLRIGLGVSLLPLAHPVRLAEEIATLDHVCKGRLDFGVGRSAFAVAYAGYGIPYEESRARFNECLDIMTRAWTEENFSYNGQYHQVDNVTVVPRPYQKPYPPIRVAATTSETFPLAGHAGQPIFLGLRGSDLAQNMENLGAYRKAWREAGHPGDGDVYLRIPVYVHRDAERAYEDPKASTVFSYNRRAEGYLNAAAAAGTMTERAATAESLKGNYDDLLRTRLAFGTPEAVLDKLRELRDEMGLSGVVIEANVGGAIPRQQVYDSVRLFAEEVMPGLR